ncbi:VTT domain-containing protein [Candidatus Woesearchaeota archaeon]|nr:VTT domain-containing protein [Candidatus Woesearchaeota archaeon]
MLAELTEWILALIRSHGVLGVVFGVMLEEIIVPIPSPVVIMAAGAILVEPGITFQAALPTLLFVITLPAAITALAGSFIPYGVAYYGGKPLIERTERYLGLGWQDVQKMQRRVMAKEELSVFLFRALPVMPLSLVSAAAGLVRMDVKRYALSTLGGMLPRIFVLALLGWKLGELYLSVAMRFENLESVVTFTLVGLLVLGVLAVRFRIVERIQRLVL